MKIKTRILDSSDEESESDIVQKNDIIENLKLQLFASQNSADFALNLALIVHYASDRVFKNTNIDLRFYKTLSK
jgi:hypothetical protein